MLGSAQFMVDFRGMHFNAKKDLYINFHKHALTFCKEILRTINYGGHYQCYVLTTSVCADTNNYSPIYDIYGGLIFQHALANIINVSQRFIKSLHQSTKPHRLVGQFPNRQRGKKISLWLNQLFSSSIKRGYWRNYCNKICQIDHWYNNKRWWQREGVPPTSHFKEPVLCTVVLWAWIHCHEFFKVLQVIPHHLNMNQYHLMQPGLKDQQYWIVWATMIFGGSGAIKPQN